MILTQAAKQNPTPRPKEVSRSRNYQEHHNTSQAQTTRNSQSSAKNRVVIVILA